MNNRGYSMIELVLVIVIIGILATVAMQSLGRSAENRRFDLTVEEMDRIVRAIAGDERLVSSGYRTDFGYIGDVGALPPDLDALVANPGGYSTWKGPYLSGDFVENSDDHKTDAWNAPYSYGGGVTVASTGGGSSITKRFASRVADLVSNTVTGFVRDARGTPPGDSASNVTVTLFYPDGGGSITSSSTSPSRSGEFAFTGIVPMGLRRLRAVVSGVDDTTSKYVVVNPGSITLTELRFPSDIWGGAPGGSGSGRIQYVDGTAQVFGPGSRNIRFDIKNTGVNPVSVSFVTLSYTVVPDAYYRRILWGGINVYNNPAIGSGETALFSSTQVIDPSQTVTIAFEDFRDSPGGGSFVDMSGLDFHIVFSSGDDLDFSTP
jgi:prepilin-type N-terminal cleavage/methylation domain-containing protein